MCSNRSDMPSRPEIMNFWSDKFSEEGLHDVVSTGSYGQNVSACFACGSQNRIERAHITPIISGGSNDADNIHLLCRSCHSDSEVFSGEDYMKWFYWRLEQPGYLAVRMAMLMNAGLLPCKEPHRSVDPVYASGLSDHQIGNQQGLAS